MAKAQHPDITATLWAHPEFKGWICGVEGRKRLEELSVIAMERDVVARNSLSRHSVVRAIEWQFCDRFLKKRQPITHKKVDQMLKRAVSYALSKCIDQHIAIPCCVTEDSVPESFQLAGIEFVRTSAFLSRLSFDGFRDESGWLKSSVISESIERNPWIAIATVRGMDKELGLASAQTAVQAALEFLAAYYGRDQNPET